MTHDIFGERFLGNRTPAWHGLGQVFTEPITLLEGIGRIDAGYLIEKAPVFAKIGNRYIEVPDQAALVRQATTDDPQPRVVGMASDQNYGMLQNHELARLIDPLSQQWPLETIGVLAQGATIFFTLKAGTMRVGRSAREEVEQYFLFEETRTGRRAGRIAFTPVRVVCKNTLSMGLNAAVAVGAMRHTADYGDEVKFRLALTKQMQRVMAKTKVAFDLMARAVLRPDAVQAMLETTYPFPKMPAKVALAEALTRTDRDELGPDFDIQLADIDKARSTYDYYRDRATKFREVATDLFSKISDEFPAIGNTAWAAYNAVVELEDYRKGGDGALASALFGPRAVTKTRAFEASYAAAVAVAPR